MVVVFVFGGRGQVGTEESGWKQEMMGKPETLAHTQYCFARVVVPPHTRRESVLDRSVMEWFPQRGRTAAHRWLTAR